MARTTALGTRVRRYLTDPVATWRTGSRESQAITLAVLMLGVLASFAVSYANYDLMPFTAFFVWLLLGMILLRFVPLLVLCSVTPVLAVIAMLNSPPMSAARISALVSMGFAILLILFTSSRQQSGLPGPVSEAMLTDLRRRLQAHGRVPELPPGWTSQSSMLAASGIGYGGDFLVTRLDPDTRRLEIILVDVCGKGVGAASQALQFGGALGGLIGSMPPRRLLGSANDFLLRLHQDSSFATAAHVSVDLGTGDYELLSAGHPPALRLHAADGRWRPEGAKGTALGIVEDPPMHGVAGTLAPGEALMFYTDGVLDFRSPDLDVSLAWVCERADAAIAPGMDGAAARLLADVRRGDDDRAVLILHREPEPRPEPHAGPHAGHGADTTETSHTPRHA